MRALIVSEEQAGERLDRFLATASGLSRSQVTRRIECGDVLINGEAPSKPGQRLAPGEVVSLEIPPPPPADAIPEDIPLDVVYEDTHMLVINKEADMVVHPSPGHDSGTLVNALVYHYDRLAPDLRTEDDRPRPGIVHRLDRGTSGLMLVARDLRTHEALSGMIMAREVSRRYLAIIHGPNIDDTGTWETLHGRHPRDRKRFSSKVKSGKDATTHWKVLARSRGLALIECKLDTGRTHQIRVHCADHGHPILGDSVYAGRRKAPRTAGRAAAFLERQALHAWRLELTHPLEGTPLRFQAPPPFDMLEVIRVVFGKDLVRQLCIPDAPTTPHPDSELG